MSIRDPRRGGGRRGNRGAALLLALFLVMLIEFIGLTFLGTVHAGVAQARARTRAARLRHRIEGAFEMLAARPALRAGEEVVTLDEAAITVRVEEDGTARRLSVVRLEADGEPPREADATGLEARAEPVAGGGWRLEMLFP